MKMKNRIPYVEICDVDLRKIKEYLLNLSHEEGKSKARFFHCMGFNSEEPEILRKALKSHAITHNIKEQKVSKYGTKYIVQSNLITPDGRNPKMISVWFVENKENIPKLVTAYPL